VILQRNPTSVKIISRIVQHEISRFKRKLKENIQKIIYNNFKQKIEYEKERI